MDDDGVVWQRTIGPLSGQRAGLGLLLMPGDRHLEDLEFGENSLYSAAVRAGWLTIGPAQVMDVAAMQITVSVRRRNPSWEAYAHGDADTPEEDVGPAPVSANAAAAPVLVDEDKLLASVLEIAAGDGDPNPEMVQHARGTRFDVTRRPARPYSATLPPISSC